MIRPITFTGIKNIGYTKAYTHQYDFDSTRNIINMQLTDDKQHKDLTEYKKIIGQNPNLQNTVDDRFLNVEVEFLKCEDISGVKTKINGVTLMPAEDNSKIIGFAQRMIKRISHFKEKDFKKDNAYDLSETAENGLICNEHIDDYLDGSAGSLDLLKDTGLTEKFDYYFNDPSAKLSEKDKIKVSKAADGIIATLHNPAYVHNGAVYMDALLKGTTKIYDA